MVKTWAVDVTPLLEEERYRQYFRQAPKFRREKAMRLQTPQKRAQSIGVWALYEQMKRAYGFGEGAVYNFSHSGDYALCSVALDEGAGTVQVGCDIEKIRTCDLRLARRWFSPSEYEVLVREPEGTTRDELFTRYWVLKESFVKAVGMGFKMPLNSFEVSCEPSAELRRGPEGVQESFFYMETETKDKGYRIAVCSTDAVMDSEIYMELKL